MGSCIIKPPPLRVDSATQTNLTAPSPPDSGWMVQKQEVSEDQVYTSYAYRKVKSKSGVIRHLPVDASPIDVFHAANDYETIEW